MRTDRAPEYSTQQVEKLYRELYDEVRVKKEDDIDFSMDTVECKKKVKCWFKCLFSGTVLLFHLCIIVIILVSITFLLYSFFCLYLDL